MDLCGTHALLCKRGGHVVRRHNAIRDCLAAVLKSTNVGTVLIEQNAPATPEHLLRPDIVFHDANGRIKHLDVEVCTMHPSRVQGEHRAGVLIEREEGVKRRKYAHLPLIPCVCSHVGRLGKGLQSLLRSVHKQPDLAERSTSIAVAYQSISCALQKGNVAILAAAGTLKGM